MLHDAQSQFDKAEPLYRRALAIREKAYPAEHPAIATSLNNLGEMYSAQRRYDKAEPLLKRALAIRDKLPADHPDRRRTQDNLAALYGATGQFALAEEYAPTGTNRQDQARKLMGAPGSASGSGYGKSGGISR
jgi:tetratricopeptide (TPR) repeat protein